MNYIPNNNIPRNHSTRQISEGYFRAPNFIFDLPISSNAKLILLYFCRRADISGRSFPSFERISKDTGLKSHTTIRKYISELTKNGHITILQRGKEGIPNRYQLSVAILNMFRLNGERREDSTPSKYDDPAIPASKNPPSNSDYSPSNSDDIPHQNMTPKENSFKENTNKENTGVENEKKVFDPNTHNFKFPVREKENTEIPIPSRNLGFSVSTAPTRKKKNTPPPPPSNNEPSQRARLTRRAINLLLRRAKGEEVDLSEIFRQFDELKTPFQ